MGDSWATSHFHTLYASLPILYYTCPHWLKHPFPLPTMQSLHALLPPPLPLTCPKRSQVTHLLSVSHQSWHLRTGADNSFFGNQRRCHNMANRRKHWVVGNTMLRCFYWHRFPSKIIIKSSFLTFFCVSAREICCMENRNSWASPVIQYTVSGATRQRKIAQFLCLGKRSFPRYSSTFWRSWHKIKKEMTILSAATNSGNTN